MDLRNNKKGFTRKRDLVQLKKKALAVPRAMQGCINLSQEELQQLKMLLDKALLKMEDKR